MAAPLLRVAAMDNHVEALVKVVRDVADRAGASTRPMDGQHGPGVYATAPVASALGVSTGPRASRTVAAVHGQGRRLTIQP